MSPFCNLFMELPSYTYMRLNIASMEREQQLQHVCSSCSQSSGPSGRDGHTVADSVVSPWLQLTVMAVQYLGAWVCTCTLCMHRPVFAQTRALLCSMPQLPLRKRPIMSASVALPADQ